MSGRTICGEYENHQYYYNCNYFRDGFCTKYNKSLKEEYKSFHRTWMFQGFDDSCPTEHGETIHYVNYIRLDTCKSPLWKKD